MDYTHFKIENFRGVQNTTLRFNRAPMSRIFTLVGLNESGKTTILEAINFFQHNTETLKLSNISGYIIRDYNSLIPIAKRSNFNGSTKLVVGLSLDASDKMEIKSFCRDTLNFSPTQIPDSIEITQAIKFKDSKVATPNASFTWSLVVKGRKPRARVDTELAGDDLLQLVRLLTKRLPGIIYFPNFLFEIPDKIYLDTSDDEQQLFYRLIIQDVLDVLDKNTDIDTHLVSRLNSKDPADKRALEGLVLKMQRQMSDTIFGRWNEIFKKSELGHRKLQIRGIKLDLGLDGTRPFASFKIEDSDGYFQLGERSLGFRWFFSFLLFTQYRGFRKNVPPNTLFLFDEPASNLHPTAQAKLLETFQLVAEKCRVVYTTHSHHMVNPKWLESTYVVRNYGLNYDSELEYNSHDTDIRVQTYRDFVSAHPSDTTYFQPILDVLEYTPSRLEAIPDAIFVEGKNDYYAIKFAFKTIGLESLIPAIIPATSSSKMETLISLYLGWGRRFVVLLDSDKEGKKQKDRYLAEFGIDVSKRVFTLQDIALAWDNMETEDLFFHNDKKLIQGTTDGAAREFDKKAFNRSIQELLQLDATIVLSSKTKENFRALFAWINEAFTQDKK